MGRRYPSRSALPAQPALPPGARQRESRPALRRPLSLPAARDSPRHPPLAPARTHEGPGRRFRRTFGLGTPQLVCRQRSGTRIPLRLVRTELVRQQSQRTYGGARRRRPVRHVVVRQDPCRRAGCLPVPPKVVRQRRRCRGWTACLHPDAQRARRHRKRPHGHATVGNGVPSGRSGRHRRARYRLAKTASERRVHRHHRHHRPRSRLVHHGAQGPRPDATGQPR